MKKIKMSKMQNEPDVPATVEHYSKFKGIPMVRIGGNFFRGGFNMSKNKVKAVLSLSKELKKFADGDLDQEIKALGEGEVLQDD